MERVGGADFLMTSRLGRPLPQRRRECKLRRSHTPTGSAWRKDLRASSSSSSTMWA